MLVCNPRKWAIDKFLAAHPTSDTWGIRPYDAPKFAPGQLAIVRVDIDRRSLAERQGRKPLVPGIYAICEIESSSFPGTGANDAHWAENAGRAPGWPTVGIRYLRNYLERPLSVERLRKERPDVSPRLLDGFQAASFPIEAVDFHAVLELLGEDDESIVGAPMQNEAPTLDRLAALESKFMNASPEVKMRIGKSIERGPIGAEVKRANNYRCQLCEALGLESIGFKKRNGEPYVEASSCDACPPEGSRITVCYKYRDPLRKPPSRGSLWGRERKN
ncbi:EVE domain-containing protein [Steroidobacter gossypii]|uniref:EVE domain-containing protein n=1 Tax=Steroidobacter gossypii TaxID=2805490 RepID=UPI001E342E04|nr:EVE domain-containing protein [Steroidobacter gossypii]